LKLAENEQNKIASTESNRIFGEALTVCGIPIHFRKLLSKVRNLNPWLRLISYIVLIILTLTICAFYTRSFWLPLIDRVTRDSGDIEEISAKSKLFLSLKDICQDIDSRPLLQQELTAKQYTGIKIENEHLILVHARESSIEETISLMMIRPEQLHDGDITGRYIRFNVDKEKYPELVAAKQGTEFRISGRISNISNVLIDLSDVSLSFD